MKVIAINNLTKIGYFNNNNKINSQYSRVQNTNNCDSVHFTGSKKQAAKKIVILLGAPNSGKGTYARKIAEKFGIPQISTGDILRSEVKKESQLGLEAKKYMTSGGLVPDELIMKIFKKRIGQEDCAKGFILDGFPRTINQAKQLDETLKSYDNHSLKIVNLDVDRAILFERSANRYTCPSCSRVYSIKEGYNPETSLCECGSKLTKRADDTPEILAKRLDNYEQETFPLVDYYGEKVKNVGVHGKDAPADETLAKVIKNIE